MHSFSFLRGRLDVLKERFRWPGWGVILVAPALLLEGCSPAQEAEAEGRQGMPPTSVVAVPAVRQDVIEKISLVGTLLANEMVELQSETEGIIEEIGFEEGEQVEQGDLLVRLDAAKLSTALEEAKAALELARADFERSRRLYRDQLVSQQEFDQAESQFQATKAEVERRERNLRDTRIVAPFAGTIGAREVSPGQVISRNTTLTWLVDLDPMKVEVNVPERFLSELSLNQELALKVAAYPKETFVGRVYFIAPFVDPATRTAVVKARINNPEHRLRPGMFANLDLTLNVREKSIVIPEAAIAQIVGDGRAMIYVVGPESRADLISVVTGVRMPGRIEILDGLTEGQMVIVEGTQKIGPGSPVEVAPPEEAEPYRLSSS